MRQPQPTSPCAEHGIDQILAVLVLILIDGRRLLDERGRHVVRREIQGRISIAERGETTDEFVAVRRAELSEPFAGKRSQ